MAQYARLPHIAVPPGTLHKKDKHRQMLPQELKRQIYVALNPPFRYRHPACDIFYTQMFVTAQYE